MTTPTTAERLADAELGWDDTLADYIGRYCPTEYPWGADRAAELIMTELVRPVLADLERARRIAVALEQENAHLAAELAEEKASHDPRLSCLIVKTAPDKDVYVGWSDIAEGPTGVWSRETALEYGFPPSLLDRADNNGSSAAGGYRLGHWDNAGFIAEQRGWLRRDRLGDYAVEYLNGDRQAAYGLLEPFEGESEVRK